MSKTFGSVAIVILLGAAAVGCGGGPAAQCREFSALVCKRAFECYDATARQSPQFIAIYGASETECRNKQESDNQCATSDTKPCTDSSMKYYPDKAQACMNDIRTASCESYTMGTFPMSNCAAVCM